MQRLDEYPLAELKLVYRLLHRQLSEQLELMDSRLLDDLQSYLQQQARETGVDVSLHAEWAAWLNTPNN